MIVDDAQFRLLRDAAETCWREGFDLIGNAEHHHACQHAEQAAQMACKALLRGVGEAKAARLRDLVALLDVTEQATGMTATTQAREAVVALARYTIPPGHPDGLPGSAHGAGVTPDEARSALTDTETLLAFVDKAWSELRSAP